MPMDVPRSFVLTDPQLIRANVQALEAYVPGQQTRDPDVVKLNTNENPYPPPDAVMEALSAISPDDLRRYPDPVCMGVRERLAARHGVGVEQIICGNGSDELLAYVLRAFVEPTESVGYFDPSYSLYPVLCEIQNLTHQAVPLNAEFGWPDEDPSGMKLFFVTNPNAPTSLQFSRSDVERFCDAFEGIVVLDEAYVDFADWNGMDLAASHPRVLVTRSFSKSMSLAGIRFGYAVGPASLIEAMYKIKDSYNLSLPAQRCAEAALDASDELDQQARRILATRERSTQRLQDRGFRVAASQTNFLWVQHAEIPARDLFKHLNNRRILVRFFNRPRICEYLRITIGTDEQMDRLLEALDEYIGTT